LTLTLRGIALDTLITKTNPTSNTYLAYDFKPVELDIKYACEQGGCDGAGPFSFS
jgi:hypothetical protein